MNVAFDGYGDSGQIEEITFTGHADCEVEPPVGEIDIRNIIHDGSGVTSETMPVASAIEHICYDLLSQHHDGWENNEGAYGSFTFDVKGDVITYTHNERYEQVETFEHEL